MGARNKNKLIVKRKKQDIVKNAMSNLSTDAKKHINLEHANELFSSCLIEIKKEVANGCAVMLSGFGKFEPFFQKERNYRSPQDSNVYCKSEEKTIPKFEASKIFKDEVNDRQKICK